MPGNRPIPLQFDKQPVRAKNIAIWQILGPPGTLKTIMDKDISGVYIDVYQNRCKPRFYRLENALAPAVRYFAHPTRTIEDFIRKLRKTSPDSPATTHAITVKEPTNEACPSGVSRAFFFCLLLRTS